MNIETAPSLEEDGECSLCTSEGSFVVYDGDKVCINCGHSPQGSHPTAEEDSWDSWRNYRKTEYSGWYGPDRIKFVGGFVGPWDFERDL